jgi:hypothetical protein
MGCERWIRWDRSIIAMARKGPFGSVDWLLEERRIVETHGHRCGGSATGQRRQSTDGWLTVTLSGKGECVAGAGRRAKGAGRAQTRPEQRRRTSPCFHLALSGLPRRQPSTQFAFVFLEISLEFSPCSLLPVRPPNCFFCGFRGPFFLFRLCAVVGRVWCVEDENRTVREHVGVSMGK